MSLNPSDLGPEASSSLRQAQITSHTLEATWEHVLKSDDVSSSVSVDHLVHWRTSLQLGSDPSDYWVQHCQTELDGKECADTMLCAMQKTLDEHPDAALRYILLKFALRCRTVPSSLFVEGVESVDATSDYIAGGFSDVYRSTLNNNPVAAKRLRASLDVDSKSLKMLCREALLWRQLKHPSVLPFLGLAKIDYPRPSFCMVSPWMCGGNLASLLKTRPVKAKAKFTWIGQIYDGLRYLHGTGIIHGDLRGANILLDRASDAVIADFGLSYCIDAGDSTMSMTNRTGAIRWMAPEVLDGDYCSYAGDVYSFACTCLEIVTQKRPLADIEERRVRRYIREGHSPNWPSMPTRDTTFDILGQVIRPCFRSAPHERPNLGMLAKYLRFSFYGQIIKDRIHPTGILEEWTARHEVDDDDVCDLLDAALREMYQKLDCLSSHDSDNDSSHELLRTVLELSSQTGVVPSTLFQAVQSDWKVVDRGGLGDAYVGRLGEQTVALRCLRYRHFRGCTPKMLCRSVIIWRQLKHPHVLPFLGLASKPSSNIPCDISPWMKNGSIIRYLSMHPGTLPPRLKCTWILQIARGLAYIHDNSIVHGNPCGDNVLLDENLDAHLKCFEFAALVDEGVLCMGGTRHYMAPELYNSKLDRFNDVSPTFKSDVYSFACVCLKIVSEELSWCGIEEWKHGALHDRDLRWPTTKDAEIDQLGPLMEQCWLQDPLERPSMQGILLRLEDLLGPPLN